MIAFVSAALETMARVQVRHDSVFMSTQEIWYTMWPTSFTKFRLFVEGDLHPALWDPVALIVLAFPMWILFGAPGAFLFIRNRPNRGDPMDEQDEDSFFVLDRLAKAAKEEGYTDSDDDFYTDHGIQWGDEDLDDNIRSPGDVPDDWANGKDRGKAKAKGKGKKKKK